VPTRVVHTPVHLYTRGSNMTVIDVHGSIVLSRARFSSHVHTNSFGMPFMLHGRHELSNI